MRAISLGLAAALLASPALGQTGVGVGIGSGTATSSANAGNSQATGGNANAQGGGVTFNQGSVPANTRSDSTIEQRVTTSGGTVSRQTGSLRNAPATFAPGLTAAGLETCLGSISGGVSGMGFGVSLGSTVPDSGCSARLDARTLWSMGLKKAAVARLCLTAEIQRSMPEVCAEYLPVANAQGYGPAARPETVAQLVPSDGPIEVIERRTGATRLCARFDAARGRCLAWAR